MDAYESRSHSHPPKRLWLTIFLGLPIATLVLLGTQSNVGDWVSQSILHRSQLTAPYRYPYPDSLSPVNQPTARVEQDIAAYQAHLRQNSGNSLDRAALAIAYLQMARTTGQGNWYLLAEEAARQSLAGLPFANPQAASVLARVAEARHDFRDALERAAQIPDEKETLAIQVTSHLALGDLAAADQASDRLVDLTLSPNAFTLKALVQIAQGKDQDALQSFHHALAVEEAGDLSSSARIRTLLGRFYYERGQLTLAADLYREALRILPTYTPARLNLAQLDLRLGHYRSAERQYGQVVATSNGSPTIYDGLILRGRAQIHALQGNRTAAAALWSEAETGLRQSVMGNNSGSFGHRRDLARLLLERGRSQDIAEAIALMATEVKLRRDAETLNTYSWALVRGQRWQEAQQIVQEAIATGTHDADLFYRAGEIEQALGNGAKATEYFEEAQAIDPHFNPAARHAVGFGVGLGL